MPDQTPAEQLRATAVRLREDLGVKETARRVEHTFVAICADHDAATLVCFNCHHFDAGDETLAALLVSLLNARLPLADLFEDLSESFRDAVIVRSSDPAWPTPPVVFDRDRLGRSDWTAAFMAAQAMLPQQ